MCLIAFKKNLALRAQENSRAVKPVHDDKMPTF